MNAPDGCAPSDSVFQESDLCLTWELVCFSFLPPQYSLVNEPLIELANPGASGSLFYLTSDDEFIIKTVQHKEAKFLQRLLPGYYMVRLLVLLLSLYYNYRF